MTDQINIAAEHLIEHYEGCRLEAYQDVVGVWTIGYGHTGDVSPGEEIDETDADDMLHDDLTRFEEGVDAALNGADCTANEFGAMVSLAYNVGLGNFYKSTVLRKHLARDYAGAADAFLLWNKAGGKVWPALTQRRRDERTLYLTEDEAATPAPTMPAPTPEQVPAGGFTEVVDNVEAWAKAHL